MTAEELKRYDLSDFHGGWFLGDFTPTAFASQHAEVALKTFKAGDAEPEHFQRVSTELSLVVTGACRLAGQHLTAGALLVIPPMVPADFVALSDVTIVVIKLPSIPGDKVIGRVSS